MGIILMRNGRRSGKFPSVDEVLGKTRIVYIVTCKLTYKKGDGTFA